MSGYRFHMSGGKLDAVRHSYPIYDRKAECPDLVRLVIPKDQALALAIALLNSIEGSRHEEDVIAMFGKLEKVHVVRPLEVASI